MEFWWFLLAWQIVFNFTPVEVAIPLSDRAAPALMATPMATPTPTSQPTPTATPVRLYKTPLSPAGAYYRNMSDKSAPAAKKLAYIANQPYALWVSGMADVWRLKSHLQTAKSQKSWPIVVAYRIPFRNCDLNGGQGAKTADEYKKFVDSLLEVISDNRVILIIEPDALAGWGCLDDSKKQQRVELLKYFTGKLAEKTNVYAYMDAGHPKWLDAKEAIARLKLVGIDNIRGFSLNVANFVATDDNNRYGKVIAERLGKSYVVDTSRNGSGPTADYQWCNPRGRMLGEEPRFAPVTKGRDGYLWIKPPGESDGNCNGGPAAGQWWPEYAIELAAKIE